MLLLYLRGFLSTRRRLRYLAFGLIIYVLLSHFLVIMFGLIGISPLYCIWKDFGTDDEARARICRSIVDDTEFYFAVNASTIVLDILILIIPSRMVWQLQVPKQQKNHPFWDNVCWNHVCDLSLRNYLITDLSKSVTLASILRLIYTLEYVYYVGDFPDNTGLQFRYFITR